MVYLFAALLNFAWILAPGLVAWMAFRRVLLSRSANMLLYASIGALALAVGAYGIFSVAPLGSVKAETVVPALITVLLWWIVRDAFGWSAYFRYDSRFSSRNAPVFRRDAGARPPLQ